MSSRIAVTHKRVLTFKQHHRESQIKNELYMEKIKIAGSIKCRLNMFIPRGVSVGLAYIIILYYNNIIIIIMSK